jgi:type I restriction enzyme S subunit
MLNSKLGRIQVANVQYGTAQKQFNISDAIHFKVPVPPLCEQEAIAGALSDADAWIESLEQLIAKKRQIKQGAMQELLTGKRRLPGFSGKWETKLLGDVADVKTGPFGSALHEGDYKSTGTPIITVEHLGEFGVEHVNLPLVSDSDCQRLRAYTLELGDIVFSRVGSVDRNALIRPEEVGWLFSGRLLRVRLKCKKVSSPFLSYQFHGESFISSVRSVAVGQTMACLNTQILKGILIRLPSIEEQTAIASVLFDMDTEIESLESKLSKAREIKQGMMQELLTGRIRLA